MSSKNLDNVAIISAAGSGKTYDICKIALEKAALGKRVLITTYTNRGAETIRKEIRSKNCGVLHPLVVVKTWFSFMMSDLIKPYQRYLTHEISGVKAFDFSQTYGVVNYAKTGTRKKYLTDEKRVRSNEAASLVCLINKLSDGKVIKRIEEIYSDIYLDEIQDMAGDDIEIIRLLMESSIGVVVCGDSKQATFSTHNSRKNKKQTGKNIWKFFNKLEKRGLVRVERKCISRRFNKQICCFVNAIFPLGEPITTIMTEETDHDGVFLIETKDINTYKSTYAPQILRHDIRTNAFGFTALNFGECKGETFDRILIIPNGPFKDFILKRTALKSPEKYYVAVTRPKYSIAFVFEKIPKTLDGYEEVFIKCGSINIRALKFVGY